MSDILNTHRGEVAAALRKHRYEVSDSGILLRDSRVFLGGALKTHDYRDGTNQYAGIDANTLLIEGLVHALNVLMPPQGGYAQITQWYIAPFSGNYEPDNTLTAATFPATATEFTKYTLGTRLPLTVAAAATTPSTGNTGNEAQMVLNSDDGPYNIYGAAIVSSSAKSAVSGKGLAAIRLGNPKLGMEGGEKLGFEYVLTAADAG